MKKMNLKWVSAIALTAVALAMTPVLAGNDSMKVAVSKAIGQAPVSELAAKAAALVAQAKVAEQADLAVAAVEVVVGKHPGVATAVVAAIATSTPEVAARVAARAAQLNPDQAAEIARAAALAAPKYAAQIASAVTQAVPKSAVRVANAVMNAVPSASVKVAEAVVAMVPASQSQVKPKLTRGVSALSAVGSASTARPTSLPFVEQLDDPINPGAPKFQDRPVPSNTRGLEIPGAYGRP